MFFTVVGLVVITYFAYGSINEATINEFGEVLSKSSSLEESLPSSYITERAQLLRLKAKISVWLIEVIGSSEYSVSQARSCTESIINDGVTSLRSISVKYNSNSRYIKSICDVDESSDADLKDTILSRVLEDEYPTEKAAILVKKFADVKKSLKGLKKTVQVIHSPFIHLFSFIHSSLD